MSIEQAIDLIANRDPFLRHAAQKAHKAVQVRSPIRVKRVVALLHDALNYGGATYTEQERADINLAAREFVRANPDSQ